tara:strand:+ start:2822 stop:3082 length:261 start_codon:yes stop_codon:yes gene_type:complete
MNLNKQNLINKILYRANYRGSKEMDIFVSSFVKTLINKISMNELEDLNKIINLNDEKLVELINSDLKIDNFNQNIILKLRNFRKKI